MIDKYLILACSSCGAKNRVPLSRLDDKPNCGKCKSIIPVDVLGRVNPVTDQNFDKEVMGSFLPVFLECWAPWCGPCKVVGPILDQLAIQYRAQIRIVKLNVDENPGIAQRYTISSIPTMMVVKNGRVVEVQAGTLPKEHLERLIEKHI
jgi:thioredoxin 2